MSKWLAGHVGFMTPRSAIESQMNAIDGFVGALWNAARDQFWRPLDAPYSKALSDWQRTNGRSPTNAERESIANELGGTIGDVPGLGTGIIMPQGDRGAYLRELGSFFSEWTKFYADKKGTFWDKNLDVANDYLRRIRALSDMFIQLGGNFGSAPPAVMEPSSLLPSIPWTPVIILSAIVGGIVVIPPIVQAFSSSRQPAFKRR